MDFINSEQNDIKYFIGDYDQNDAEGQGEDLRFGHGQVSDSNLIDRDETIKYQMLY